MAEMSAILRLKAAVSGVSDLEAMAKGLGDIEKQGNKTTKALEGMAASAGGLAGGFKALIPLLSGGGLVMLAQRSIEAGDKLWDMSQRTGVSVEMLSKLGKVADMTGTDIEGVQGFLVKLGRSMAAAADSTKALAQTHKTSQQEQVEAVQRGEREQTRILQNQSDERMQTLTHETDRRLRELNKRYRKESQLLNDNYDDKQDIALKKLAKAEEQEKRSIERRYAEAAHAFEKDKQLTDQYRQKLLENLKDKENEELDILQEKYQTRHKILTRQFRDEKQQRQDQLDDLKQQSEDAVKLRGEREKNLLKNQTQEQVQEIKDRAQQLINAIKAPELRFDEDGMNATKVAETFRKLGISVTDFKGQLRSSQDVMFEIAQRFAALGSEGFKAKYGMDKSTLAMALAGRSAQQAVPFLNELNSLIGTVTGMTAKQAEASDASQDKMERMKNAVNSLGGKIAMLLLPVLDKTTEALTGLLTSFNSLDPKLQIAIGATAAFAIAWGPLSGVLVNTLKLLTQIGPVVKTLFSPLITLLSPAIAWLSSVALPALVAFFSGPVGWITLAGLAGLAIYKFRDQVTKALDNLAPMLTKGLDAAVNGMKGILDKLVQTLKNKLAEGFKFSFDFDEKGVQGLIARVVPMIGKIAETLGKLLIISMAMAITASAIILVAAIQGVFALVGAAVSTSCSVITTVIDGVFKSISDLAWTLIGEPLSNIWSKMIVPSVKVAGQKIKNIWNDIVSFFDKNIIKPLQSAWEGMTTALPNALKAAGNAIRNIWDGILSGIKSAINATFSAIGNTINSWIQSINGVINRIAQATQTSLPTIPAVPIPRFAEGGYLTQPTVGLLAEAGEPEYAIPASRMAAASSAYLAGARGPAVLSGSSARPGPVQINITTGPVMQSADGQRWLTLEDAQAMVRQAVGQLRGDLLQPSTRAAMGIG